MISKGKLPFKDPGVSFPRLWSYAFSAPIQRHQSRSGGALIFNTRERFATFAVKPLMFQQDGIPVILQGALLPVLSRKRSLPACVVEHTHSKPIQQLWGGGWGGRIGERTQGLISVISGQLPRKACVATWEQKQASIPGS